jgi:hypothetical protein
VVERRARKSRSVDTATACDDGRVRFAPVITKSIDHSINDCTIVERKAFSNAL